MTQIESILCFAFSINHKYHKNEIEDSNTKVIIRFRSLFDILFLKISFSFALK